MSVASLSQFEKVFISISGTVQTARLESRFKASRAGDNPSCKIIILQHNIFQKTNNFAKK